MKALLLAAALAAGACAETGDPAAPAANAYLGTRWVSIDGGAHAPTIEFSDSRASGTTGCNNWFGQVTQAPPALTFSAIGTTRRACEPSVMQIERDFLGVLAATQGGRIEGDVLVLYFANAKDLASY